MSDWVQDIFIDKAEVFIKIMEKKWVRAKEEAYAVANIMSKHGVTEGKILDLMCGNGRLSLYLAKLGFDVVGLDISEKLINDAEMRAERMGVSENAKFYVGDARELTAILGHEAPFDAIINAWSSIGYYDDDTDLEIFSNAAKLTRKNGLLLIIDTVNRDAILKTFRKIGIDEFEDLIIIRRNKFDPITSKLIAKWEVFERSGRNLKFITDLKIEQRLYSFHELLRILSKAGWEFIEAYHNILTGEEFRYDSPFNIVAKRV